MFMHGDCYSLWCNWKYRSFLSHSKVLVVDFFKIMNYRNKSLSFHMYIIFVSIYMYINLPTFYFEVTLWLMLLTDVVPVFELNFVLELPLLELFFAFLLFTLLL